MHEQLFPGPIELGNLSEQDLLRYALWLQEAMGIEDGIIIREKIMLLGGQRMRDGSSTEIGISRQMQIGTAR